MKTFESWLTKTNYVYMIKRDYELEFTAYQITGTNGKCIVTIDSSKRGGNVYDDGGNITKCKSVKDIIGLVNFLADGIIEF